MSGVTNQNTNPFCKYCGSTRVRKWADITRHKPLKPVITEHKPRGSLRLQETHIGRPRKRIRISKPMPRISPKAGKLE